MKRNSLLVLTLGSLCAAVAALAVGKITAVGAAPAGAATAVVSRVIKRNFPECKRVSDAVRVRDGTGYMVFTLFNAKRGEFHEVALNCIAATQLLNVSC